MNKYGQKRLIWLGIWVLTLVTLLTAIRYRNSKETKEVSIEIVPNSEGKFFIKENDIRKTIQKTFGLDLQGRSIADVELDHIEKVMLEQPFVDDADVFVDGNSKLGIRIIQREPIMRVIDEEGGNYYLDAKGAQMPTSRYYTARVVVVTGQLPSFSPDFQTTKLKIRLKDVFELVKIIDQNDFHKALVEQIYVNSAGEFILSPKVGNQTILLGGIEHIEEKLHRLEVFYKKAMPQVGWNKYSVINLKYNGQIVCK